MKSAAALRNRLAELSAEELAELLTDRQLLSPSPLPGRPLPQSLGQLADRLLDDRSVAEAVARLTAPGLQLLCAAVRQAARIHGPLLVDPYWNPFEPSSRSVPAGPLLDRIAQGDAVLRKAAEQTLAELRALMLVLPAAGDELALPAFVHRHLTETIGLGRPLAPLMSGAFNAPEVHRIAAGLDLPDRRNREQAQAAVVESLSDRDRVRALVATAPPEALELLAGVLSGHPLLRTHCFVPLGGRHYGPSTKYELRHGGSGDPGTDWLAAHGLLVPIGPDLVELPFEIGDALQEVLDEDFRFTPEPPPLAEGLLPVAETLPEAQAAAATAVRRVELLLAACAAAPGSLRKAGGLALRDTKRLAKAVDASEQQTRLWIDLAYHADLLGLREEPPETPPARGRGRRAVPAAGPVRLLPTGRYDGWQASSPAARLVPLVCTWAVVPEVLSWWPDEADQQPFALVPPEDGEAVELRRQVLAALTALPPGRGLGPAAALRGEALLGLVRRIDWYSPGLVPLTDSGLQRVVATLVEAELLGAVAHGRLTPVGEAVVALLAGGAAAGFPYVPGTLATSPAGDDSAAPVAALRRALDDLLPPPRRTARFQADLTAVAAGAPGSELAELLGSAADRESEGHAVVWRFGAASVRRALDGGLSAEELLTRLRAVAEGGLPQPLEYLVRDTGRTHGRMRVVRSACCIRSDDETLLVELEKSRMLAKLELRLIAPTVLISTQPPTATLQALRAAGYAPVLEAETGVTVVERAPELRAETRMPALARRHARQPEQPLPRETAVRLLAGG